jgi:hypothetical protein
LFQDEADLTRFASVFDDDDDSEQENEENEEKEEKEDETKSASSFSLFYIKKTKKTEMKKEPKKEKKINKFIYKGNFQEYEHLFNHEKDEKNEAVKIDYNTYKNQESSI